MFIDVNRRAYTRNCTLLPVLVYSYCYILFSYEAMTEMRIPVKMQNDCANLCRNCTNL